jgi:hypothetical protein
MLPKILQKPIEFVKANKEVITKVKEGAQALGEVKKSVTDGFEAMKDVASKGMKGAWTAAGKAAASDASNPTGKFNLLGKLKVAGGVFGTITGLAKFPGAVGTAVKDIRDAVRSGSASDIAKAAHSSIDAAKGLVETAQKGLETAVTVNKLVTTYKAANAAFKAAVPGATKAVSAAAARAAMKGVFEGATKGAVKKAAVEAAMTVAKDGGKIAEAVVGSAGRAAAKAALREGGKAAGEAALKAGARAAEGALAKGAARFAPGLNIAIAALDTANAVATLRDPKASTGAKVTSCITAVGSIVAATNIPVVSQIGAAVSVVSGFIGSFF